MNLMISDEYCEEALKASIISAESQLFIHDIEKDCTSFNDAKKDIFDRLSSTIEALRGDTQRNEKIESDAALWAILIAKDRLDTLFRTVLRVYERDRHV